jgi:hypothetical protein
MIARFALAAVCITALAFSACGGGDETDATAGTPALRNTPIPTVVVEATATPVCDPPAASSMPANFPADVPVPPGYKVDAVETAPHLKVVGRVIPPESRTAAYGTVFQAILDNMISQGWSAQRESGGDGARISFQDNQGRTGRYSALPVLGCTREVELTYELDWITP